VSAVLPNKAATSKNEGISSYKLVVF